MKILKTICLLVLLAISAVAFAGDTHQTAQPASSSASASASGAGASVMDNSRAYGVGSGSPSANACQRVVFFGFSVDVETCMLQQWASILGDNPSPVKLQIACQDSMLEALPMCVKYRKPAK
jgi:hypothetical protein